MKMSYKKNASQSVKEKVAYNVIKKTNLLSFLNWCDNDCIDKDFKEKLKLQVIEYFKSTQNM